MHGEELLVLHTDMKDKLADEIPVLMATREAIGKPTMVVIERLLLFLS